MTRPRQILPDQFYLITRSCTQRQFLLRPDEDTNNAIGYCLAVAAERHNIVVLVSTVMSNHHHTVIYDRDGNCPRFIEHFHKLVARCINKKRRRRENVWAAEETCVTALLDNEAVLQELAYAAANPVKDRLVERAVQWPGLNGYRYLMNKKVLRTRRPAFYFRRDGAMPVEASLVFTIPDVLGNPEEVLAELKERVESIERSTKIARAGARVLGVRMIEQQDPYGSPTSERTERTIRPRFAGRRENRIEAAMAFSEFLIRYREARLSWLAGRSCVFPAGTYWMARFTPATRSSLAV